jgi:SOS-response transcriptional repressor LexA
MTLDNTLADSPEPPLTQRQRECLMAIQQYIAAEHQAPTLDELADRLDCSKTNVFDTLERLEARGAIRRRLGEARAIEVLRPIPATLIDPNVSVYLQRPLRSMREAMRQMLAKSGASSQKKAQLLRDLLAEQQAVGKPGGVA